MGSTTFGQPRTCDRTLATAYDAVLKSHTFRFVNNNDIVPQLPHEPLYHHVGTLKYFDANGKLRDQMSFTDNVRGKIRGFTSDLFAPGSDGIRDHLLRYYLTNIEKNLTNSQ